MDKKGQGRGKKVIGQSTGVSKGRKVGRKEPVGKTVNRKTTK